MFEFLEKKKVLLLGGNGRIGTVIRPSMTAAGPAVLIYTGTTPLASGKHLGYREARLPDDLETLGTDFDFVVVLAALATEGRTNRTRAGPCPSMWRRSAEFSMGTRRPRRRW